MSPLRHVVAALLVMAPLWMVTTPAAAGPALVAPTGSGEASCSAPPEPDEWPTFGRDLANSRTQQHPGGISPATTPTLQPVWSFSTGALSLALSDLNGTPIVSGGCVFLNTAAGDVVALSAADGSEVWRHHVALDPGTVAGLGGTFVSSPAVTDDSVLALVNQQGSPYVLALSRRPGADGNPRVLWRRTIIEGPGYYTNATPVVTNGLVLVGFSPAEGDPDERGGISIFDTRTGRLLERVYTIPQAAFEEGYAGGGIWTAPAVDEANGYAYAGTSNPYSKKIEHENTNAIIKIDIDPRRSTFGEIVGSYKGLIEQYDPALRQAIDPVCDNFGEDPNLQLILGDSAPCLQLDLDFGAPPNLFRDSSGRLLVGDLQKAGVYHAVDAASMDGVWKATVGGSCAACNAAAWASDDGAVVGATAPGATMVSLGQDRGDLRWASPIADGTHYQSTSVAGGVVFTVDNLGTLHAWEEATGLPLLKRPVQADVAGTAAGVSSSGIAIASGMVIVATGSAVVAYAPASLG